MVRVVRTAEVFQRLVEDFASLAQLDAQQHQCTVVHIPALANPRQFQTVDDVGGSQNLRIYK